MKNKWVIISIVVGVVALFGVLAIVLNKKPAKDPVPSDNTEVKEKVTITFNTDGGEAVEKLEVDKGSQVLLPSTVKSGYTFTGWYLNDTEITSTYIFNENITVTAKWEKIKETEKTFKVTFDSKGGSKVSTMTIVCGKTLTLPKNPTKDGYTFNGWEDKNGKSILNGAKLSCENVTLYAKWNKVEEPKKEETKEPQKTYTCPTGYTLNGTKCTIEENVKEKCGERGFDYNGKCVTITGSARKDTQRSCPKENVTYMSFAGQVDGKVVNWGLYGCAYYKTNDTTSDACTSHGFKWVTPENACYVKWISNNTINTCDHLNNYAYITNPNTYEGVNGLNGGCFPVSDKIKYCSDGFELANNKCVKTIDATLK